MSTSKVPHSPISHGRINLEQQRKRAKELLKAIKAGDSDALLRISRWLAPRSEPLRLAEAQLVIAREAGFSSWPALKQHTDSLDHASRQLLRHGDHELRTLHIRCGSDIQHSLKTAGFSGDFLEFSDPFCIGPLSAAEPEVLLRQRADFLAKAFDIAPADALARQQQSYRKLQQLDDYQRIVLWFEYDSYDQLILAYLLHRLHEIRPTARVELIAVDQIPGVQRFIGIGQLAPELLGWLWPRRKLVKEALLELGTQAWRALSEPSPEHLLALIKSGTPELPMLGKALERHLQQLPGQQDGLGLTERLSLQVLQQQGPLTAGQVFRALMMEREPLPYLGDMMFWWLLQPLLTGEAPLLQIEDHQPDWPQRILQLTARGEAVLRGDADGFSVRATPYWVGGVKLIPTKAHWRYHAEHQQLHYHNT